MDGYNIRLARSNDLLSLPAIELEAAIRFPPGTLPHDEEDNVVPIEILDRARAQARLWVAVDLDDTPIGFALAKIHGSMAFLAELDVLPAHGGLGIGSALLDTVVAWAQTMKLERLNLTTFSHLPWNAPMYAKRGFIRYREEDLPPELAEILAAEAARGLQNRIAMYRLL